MSGAEGNGKPLHYIFPCRQFSIMEKSKKIMAPSSWRPLDGTGVLRIPRRKTQKIKFGTWNVRSLKSPEKVYNVCKEMKRLRIDILGLSDVRWTGNGKQKIDEDYTVYYSGDEDSSNRHGVAVIINTKHLNTPVSLVARSNRTMLLHIEAKPRNVNIVQVYAPTTNGSDQDIKDFYKELEELLQMTKNHEINLVMGDFNAKVGEGEVPGVAGKFGLGTRNERGDILIKFCQENDFVIMNTCFQLPPRRLYTWTSPQHTPHHIVRNQIDYIMINNRFRNCIKSTKTYPGADIRSDHNPVIATISCTLKRVKKPAHKPKIDIRKLTDLNIKGNVANEINEWAVDTKSEVPRMVEETWSLLKTKLLDINTIFLKRDWVPKQSWMTEKIYNLMEERRLYKNCDSTKYREMDKKIRREIRYARDTWYQAKCDFVEKLYVKHDAFNLHKEIKSFVRSKKITHQLFDEHNVPILDSTKKKHLWEQYISSMFADDSRSEAVPYELSDGYSFLKDEVSKALRKAKIGKSAGPDEVHIELLKLIREENIDVLVNFLSTVYDSGHLPKDWLSSSFITLPKKANAKRCEEFRTISLMSQVLKLFLGIIHERIRAKCDEQLADCQFGFRSGVGTREALFAVQVLVQKCRDMQQDVFLCFIDYEKAFDRVLHNRLIEILHNIGLDGRDIRIIQNLYWNQRATVRVDNEDTEDVEIKRGVRQGCILSPTLFNLYSESIITEAIEDLECGVKINGRNINNIRYADDTVLIASSAKDIQEIVTRVNECSNKAGLKINIAKTKLMVISKNSVDDFNISVAGQKLERVCKYKYLGTWLNETWTSDQEIKTRIEIARSTFIKMKKVFCNRRLKIDLRTRLLRCYIWPILLYGCEAWTIKEDLRKRIEAFEMWAYRRMLAISWTQKVTNVEVLRRVNHKRELFETIKMRKVAYLGHVLRHERYELLQLIMMGKVAGRRGVGRRKKSWLRNIREWTGIASAAELFRLAKNKKAFTELTANLR